MGEQKTLGQVGFSEPTCTCKPSSLVSHLLGLCATSVSSLHIVSGSEQSLPQLWQGPVGLAFSFGSFFFPLGLSTPRLFFFLSYYTKIIQPLSRKTKYSPIKPLIFVGNTVVRSIT